MTTTPRQLKERYEQGQNITQFLRNEMGEPHNTKEIIEIAYDLQTGSYISMVKDGEMAQRQDRYSQEIVNIITSLCQPTSIMEAGVGEATTLSGVLQYLGGGIIGYGFDLSWSRVFYAKKWLHSKGISNAVLCSGDLFNIPFADNSIDVVYTSHSIEPNGGNETPILKELYRVAKHYLILIEPGYEFASDEAKRRMDFHGYCRNLAGVAHSLNYDILRHQPFYLTISDPLNPSALIIIRKHPSDDMQQQYVLACPRFKTPLKYIGNMLFSPEALVVYPVIAGIPCLRIENGIFASKYDEVL